MSDPYFEIDGTSISTSATSLKIDTIAEKTSTAGVTIDSLLIKDGKAAALSSKLITSTRDMTAANGDVAYTGVGFTPTAIIAMAGAVGTDLAIGVSDSALGEMGVNQDGAGNSIASATAILTMGTSGTTQVAVVKSYDADGFTLTWTKAGSPTGTATLIFLCFR